MEIGPDGNVYVLDWHDADICGKAVHQKDTGRVFRMAPKESRAENWDGRYADLKTFDDAKLVELQKSPSAWHARRARVILQGRAVSGRLAQGTHAALGAMLDDPEGTEDIRLRALWGLHVTGGASQDLLLSLLGDPHEHVRGWAIQLLCEDGAPSQVALDRFASMARGDSSAAVRLFLASALQRIGLDNAWPVAAGLLAHSVDNDDHNLPKMIWFGLEPLVAADPQRALDMASFGKLTLIQNYTARRAAQAGAFGAITAAIGRSTDSEVRREMLRGALDGIGGSKKVPAPDNWQLVYAKLQQDSDKGVVEAAQRLAQRFGDNEATAKMLATIADEKASTDQRRSAIRGLAAQRHKDLAPKLLSLLDNPRVTHRRHPRDGLLR